MKKIKRVLEKVYLQNCNANFAFSLYQLNHYNSVLKISYPSLKFQFEITIITPLFFYEQKFVNAPLSLRSLTAFAINAIIHKGSYTLQKKKIPQICT